MKGAASFKDHFSPLARADALYRPIYPGPLYEYLASLVKLRERAWDCGTGNGQAAGSLAEFFRHVAATDASPEQIAEARPQKKIAFIVAAAERCPLRDQSVDIVTVAQAIHWFSFDGFYSEVRRVARAGGVIAVWGYSWAKVTPEVDQIVERFRTEIVGPYWPAERRYVNEKYETIPFPFEEVKPPPFTLEERWDTETLAGYLESWSSSHRFSEERGFLPTGLIQKQLHEAWGDPAAKKKVRWDLHLHVGNVHPQAG